MSHLKNKSDFNLAAAEELIESHNYFAPSVHCSYYGCFQFIKSKLNKIGITYEKMDQDVSSSRQSQTITLNSNQYPIDLILRKIEEKKDVFHKKEVKDKIKELKNFRVISDYHNVEISYDQSIKALKLSKEIISLINNKLK